MKWIVMAARGKKGAPKRGPFDRRLANELLAAVVELANIGQQEIELALIHARMAEHSSGQRITGREISALDAVASRRAIMTLDLDEAVHGTHQRPAPCEDGILAQNKELSGSSAQDVLMRCLQEFSGGTRNGEGQ